MASLLFLLLLLIVSLISNAQNTNSNKTPLILETHKDKSTLQYLTKLHDTNLVLDLNSPISWTLCDSSPTNLGSFPSRPIPRASLDCLSAKSKSTPESGCSVLVENKIGRVRNRGDLMERISTVDQRFLFACGSGPLLMGLASGAHGILGLGKSRVSLSSQISFPDNQFTLCLSPSNGVVFVGGTNIFDNYNLTPEIKNSLIYTPLSTDSNLEYFINAKSLKIGGKKVSIELKSAKISSIVPYTTMQSSIYEKFATAYERAASEMNMTRVDSWAPFGLCYEKKPSGPNGPEIELVLQSELVKWRFLERNSLVRVSERVMCLGFIDGGLGFGDSVVLGGYQLEDMVVHFDVGNSRLGFGSLLKWDKTCSDFKLESTLVESV